MDLHVCPNCNINHVSDISFCSVKCERVFAEHKQGREELKKAFALYELYKEYVKFANAHPARSLWLTVEYNDTACLTEEVYSRGNHWREQLLDYDTFPEVKAKLEKLNEEQPR